MDFLRLGFAAMMKEMVKEAVNNDMSEVFEIRLRDILENEIVEPNGFYKFTQKLKEIPDLDLRLDLMYSTLERCGLLRDRFIKDEKSDSKAIASKEKGNHCFIRGMYTEALSLYSKTLLNAKESEMLAVAYANRSASLFKLQLYQECVVDIDRALSHNYPDNLRPKILLRRTRAAQLAQTHKQQSYCEEPPKIPLCKTNPTNPSISNAIEIKVDEKFRKHVIATKDIGIGEVITVEKSFANSIQQLLFCHCHYCLQLCYNPIPCTTCTQALYCNETCKQAAFDKFHKRECNILMSLRMVLGVSCYSLLAAKMALFDEKLPDMETVLASLNREILCDENYRITIVAAFIFYLIKKHTDVLNNADEEKEKDFKKMIMAYVQISGSETIGIREVIFESEGISIETIARGFYPVCGIYRHSCCPNVFGVAHGTTRVIRAIKSIKKGEECMLTYGPHYTDLIKEDRQNEIFMKFRFKCECKACIENWPEFTENDVASLEQFHFLCKKHPVNIDLIKSLIPQRIQMMRVWEKYEPCAKFATSERVLMHFFTILGNKRLIF